MDPHPTAKGAKKGSRGIHLFQSPLCRLGGLFALLIPDEFENYLALWAQFVFFLPEKSCLLDFVRDWEPVGHVCELLALGAIISAPPLLCSAIGAALARRCAATVPSGRFRAMACLVSFGFAAVALTIALTPRPFRGDVDVVTEYQVVDRESGQPIAGAFVRVTDAFAYSEADSISSDGSTGVDGRARPGGPI